MGHKCATHVTRQLLNAAHRGVPLKARSDTIFVHSAIAQAMPERVPSEKLKGTVLYSGQNGYG